MSNTDTRKTSDTSSAANSRVGSSDSSALWSEIYRLRAELNTIRDYDRDSKHGEGICPYGCDCPSIADKALRESLEWENLMNYEPMSRSATQLHKDSAAARIPRTAIEPTLLCLTRSSSHAVRRWLSGLVGPAGLNPSTKRIRKDFRI